MGRGELLGQLCTDLGPRLQKKGHKMVLPALMGCMDSLGRSPACSARRDSQFYRKLPHRGHGTVHGRVNDEIVEFVEGGNKVVQESALTALASTADTALRDVSKYYDHVVPLLRRLLSARIHRLSNAADGDRMRHVGWHGSWETTVGDAIEVMNIMQQLQAIV